MTDLLLLAYDYVDEFKNKEYYQEYISLSKMIDDKYYDDLIKVNKIKEEYDAVLEYGRYHPDFKDVTKKYSEAKKKLFEIDDIKRYFELDRIIEEEINEFLNKVTSSISENIPVFNKFGFITKKEEVLVVVIVDRMAFIVYFQGNEIVKRIEKMPVNIAYVSKKANYLVFYGDKKQEKSYFNQLKTIRGFKKFEMSQLFNEEYNFKLE